MTNDIERELLNAARPDLPPALRRRVLAAASPLVTPHESRLDAIWFSRGWRLAAVLVFAGVIAADAWSSSAAGLSSGVESLQSRTSVDVAVQAAIDAGLGRADVAAIAAHAASWMAEAEATREGGMEFTGAPQ